MKCTVVVNTYVLYTVDIAIYKCGYSHCLSGVWSDYRIEQKIDIIYSENTLPTKIAKLNIL